MILRDRKNIIETNNQNDFALVEHSLHVYEKIMIRKKKYT